MTGWFKQFLVLTLLCSLVLVWGCAINPVTGESQLMLLSEQGEVDLGAKTDQSVIEQYGLYGDGRLQSYVQSVGMPMARISHRPTLDWQFKVMDSPVVNAFAAPGGYIYVTRGLLAAVNDEAELAGVLGHEIGHVTMRHSASQYSNMMLANLGLGVTQSLLGSYGEALGPLLEVGTGLLFLKFSRDDEREADALGVEYSSRTGYDAARMADFFTTLEKMGSLGGEEGSRLPEFFSTHPSPVNRQATVRDMARDWQAQLPGMNFRVNREAYLQTIDGIAYGEDPRKGYREGDWYYFPEHKVQFRIPSNWAFEREGSQAQMLKPDKKAMVIFGMEQSRSLDQVAAAYVSNLQAKVLQSSVGSVDGMPSKQVYALLVDNGQRAILRSDYFLQGDQVFMFHALAAEADFPAQQDVLGQPAASFGTIQDRAKLDRQPQRIQVKTLTKSMTLQAALQSYKVAQAEWNRVAWLNGMALNDRLAAGQRIKIIK